MNPLERSLSKVEYDLNGGCWLWTGSLLYGVYPHGKIGRKLSFLPHRVLWEAANGPISSGLVVTPSCGVRLCVNPQHLRAVRKSEAMGVRANAQAQSDRWGGLLARLEAQTIIDPLTGCHEWAGQINRHGYGEMGYRGRKWRVHRLAYIEARGEIPAGLVLDHLCRNRKCCNPDHLEAVTQGVNSRRGKGSVTHCVHGHELTDDNIVRIPGRYRDCRICVNRRQRERYARLKVRRGVAA